MYSVTKYSQITMRRDLKTIKYSNHRRRGGPGASPPKEVEKIAQPFYLCKRDKCIRENLMISNCECECD